MKRIAIVGGLIALLTAGTQAYASDISNMELIAACSEKTIVFGRDDNKQLVRAGEKLNGFCSGYLQATFSALMNSSSCKAKDSDPSYLLTVYQQYVKDKKVAETNSASATLMQALRRVAECK